MDRTVWDLALGSLVGALAGCASALFLHLLDRAITLQKAQGWLLYTLPLLGALSAWIYQRWGGEAERGGSLILDEVVEFRGRVPVRMAPLVLAGTLLTHLGGGSAGREGTAIQMGAGLATGVGRLAAGAQRLGWSWLGLNASRQRLLLMAGVSGGFGSLFGTPAAGAVFGMEVITIGHLRYEGLLVCAAASFAGDGVCRLLGGHHPHWMPAAPALDWALGLKLLAFALPAALVAGAFSEATHALAAWTRRVLPHPSLRAFAGGCAVVLLALLFGRDYLNLGTDWLPQVLFPEAPVAPWAFALKFLFTTVTLGFGFKGGEVTPLFVIGALLGAALAPLLGMPVPFTAAVGYVTVFAAASNTPVASVIMGVELFGAAFAGPLVLTGFLAYVLVGHRGIYGGHRVQTSKKGL
ncbi:MAG TPA: chloride channel protein [Holophaga sp.]|nr:chloride channel protein [Holophaga sp.]